MEDRIEFDSVITEKALNDFKMYHVFHNIGGVFGYVFAAFAIVMCVLGVIFKMSPKYIVMMGLFGVFFFHRYFLHLSCFKTMNLPQKRM